MCALGAVCGQRDQLITYTHVFSFSLNSMQRKVVLKVQKFMSEIQQRWYPFFEKFWTFRDNPKLYWHINGIFKCLLGFHQGGLNSPKCTSTSTTSVVGQFLQAGKCNQKLPLDPESLVSNFKSCNLSPTLTFIQCIYEIQRKLNY